MKTAILQLDQFDNVLSIKEKISWSKTQRVLLVWPNKGKINLSLLDVLLILRYAENLGAQVSIVSDDPVIMMQMNEIGISCFTSIPEAQKKPWRKPKIKNRSVVKKLEDPDRQKLDSDSRLVESPKTISTKMRWLIFVLGLLATLLLILIFIPSATVTIFPDTITQELEMSFHADPTIKDTNLSGAIPALQVTVVVEKEFEGKSSGTINFPGEKATGEVTFTNLSDKVINIPKGTIVSTDRDPEIRFETTKNSVLASGIDSEITVPVECLTGGTKGNLSKGKIVLIESELGGELSVYNEKMTDGGTDLKTFSPTETDYDKLKEDSIKSIKSAAIVEIKNLYPDSFLVPTETMKITQYISEERIPEVGFPADQFRLNIKAEVSAWIVLKKDVENPLKSALETDLPKKYMPVDDKVDFHVVNDSVIFQNDSLWWNVVATRNIIPEINQELLIQKILGKKLETANVLIRSEFLQSEAPRINIYPDFWKFLPYLPFQIKLEIND
jgi:hypothetical protein